MALHSDHILKGFEACGFKPKSMSYPGVVKVKVKRKDGVWCWATHKEEFRELLRAHVALYLLPVL